MTKKYDGVSGSGLIFIRDSTEAARELLAGLGLTGTEALWDSDAHARAREITRKMLAKVAASSTLPILVNTYPMFRTVARAVVDIAAAFDQSISDAQGRRFVRECLAARPVVTSLLATRKTIAGVAQAAVAPTVAGYAGMSAVDAAWSVAHARTVARTAVAHFGAGAKGTVRELARTITKADAEHEAQRRRRTALPTEPEAEHHRRLSELARSGIGAVALRYVLRRRPGLAADVYDFMAVHEMASLGEFTVQRLRLLDDESSTAARLWRALLDEVDLAELVRLTGAPAPPDTALVRRLLGVPAGGGLAVERLSRAANYRLPTAAVAEGVLYVPHPLAGHLLYPAASYHRDLFLGKVTEAVLLMAGLGAREVHIEHRTGHAADWAGSFDVPKAGAKAGATGSRSTEGALLLSARFPGHRTPVVPGDLLWYGCEPGWQAFGEGRIRHHQLEGELTVSHTEDLKLDGQVSATMTRLGLDTAVLAGLHTRQTTTWRLSAVFPA